MDIIKTLTEEFSLKPFQVENTVKLIDDGNTVPFIARYRKEAPARLTIRFCAPFTSGLPCSSTGIPTHDIYSDRNFFITYANSKFNDFVNNNYLSNGWKIVDMKLSGDGDGACMCALLIEKEIFED